MSTAYVEGHRHAVVTDDDHGAILQIISWLAVVIVILATILRLTIRFNSIRRPVVDDAFLCLAMLFAVAEVVAISVAVNHGLGRRADLITLERRNKILHDVYVSTILYLLALAFAKASMLLFLGRLVAQPAHTNAVVLASVATAVWTIVSVFGVAFQCQLPRPWDYLHDRCFDITTFWYFIGAVDILIDFTCVALPFWVVWTVRMVRSKKYLVISAFAFRLLVAGAQIARLILLRRQVDLSMDPFFPIAFHIASQIQIGLAVVTACIPALKPFMDQAASGLIGVSLEHREGTYNISHAYHLHSLSKIEPSNNASEIKETRRARAFVNITPHRSAIRQQVASPRARAGEGGTGDDASDREIIRIDTDVDIVYSVHDLRSSPERQRSAGNESDAPRKGIRRYNPF